MNDRVLISGSSNVALSQKISFRLKAPLIIADSKKFNDSEIRIKINADLEGKDVIIIQSLSRPANDHLMELLFLADAAKRARVKKISAIIPYLGYSRQDDSVSLIVKMLEASGIKEIITLDLHSKNIEDFFEIKITHLSCSSIFVSLVKNIENLVVISPDEGGILRSKHLAKLLSAEMVIISKLREEIGEEKKCIMKIGSGEVKGKNCVIFDDIIDSGETICKAYELLMQNGAKSVSVFVTHGVFSKNSIEKIEKLNFANFYITDTIANDIKNLKIFSVSDLISLNFL